MIKELGFAVSNEYDFTVSLSCGCRIQRGKSGLLYFLFFHAAGILISQLVFDCLSSLLPACNCPTYLTFTKLSFSRVGLQERKKEEKKLFNM